MSEIEENAAPYIEARVLPTLHRMLDPGAGTLPKAVATFEGMFRGIKVTDGDSYKQKALRFNLWVTAVSLYLVALRTRLILSIKVSEYHSEAGNVDKELELNAIWLGDYANFLVIINGNGKKLQGLPDRIGANIPDLRKARASLVQLERLPRITHTVPAIVEGPRGPISGWKTVEDAPAGWGFRDPVKSTEQRVVDGSTGSGCCPKRIEHRDQAENKLRDYLKAVEESEFKKLSETILKWKFAAEDWYDHRPPMAPKSAPKIQDDWSAATPQGTRWIQGNAVRYSVRFNNNRGPSAEGPWIDWKPIGRKAFPLLTDFPVDPLDMATTIMILRNFQNDSDHRTLIARVPASSKYFRDEIL